jgi:hypothetical protein
MAQICHRGGPKTVPTIHARHPSGFLITLDDVPRDRIHESIAWLLQHGYRPDGSGDQWPKTPSGEPLCPKHGLAMAKREKQGDVWHSHKSIDSRTGEILYCRGYATGREGDGYSI